MGEQGWIELHAESSDEADRELLSRISRSDRGALRELDAAYSRRLLRFMTRVTGQPELAQEGVNDVLLIVWRTSRSFGGRSKISTWILGIAYHRALRLLERSRRWTARFKAADYHDRLDRDHAETGISSSDAIELRDLLDQGLRRLSAEQRAVVELTYFGGYSYEEISVITGCPVNTVKTRMFYARKRLRAFLPALGKGRGHRASVSAPRTACVVNPVRRQP